MCRYVLCLSAPPAAMTGHAPWARAVSRAAGGCVHGWPCLATCTRALNCNTTHSCVLNTHHGSRPSAPSSISVLPTKLYITSSGQGPQPRGQGGFCKGWDQKCSVNHSIHSIMHRCMHASMLQACLQAYTCMRVRAPPCFFATLKLVGSGQVDHSCSAIIGGVWGRRGCCVCLVEIQVHPPTW